MTTPLPMTQVMFSWNMPEGMQVEDVLLVADADGVARVGATLVAGDDVGVLGEQVDDLSLSFVAPLGADDDLDGHAVRSWTGGAASGAKKIPTFSLGKVGDSTLRSNYFLKLATAVVDGGETFRTRCRAS